MNRKFEEAHSTDVAASASASDDDDDDDGASSKNVYIDK